MKTIASQSKPSPRTATEIFSKGMQLMERKKFASAQKNFDILLLLNPLNIDAMLQRGICKMNVGLVNLALDDFSEILMQANGKPEAYAAMAQAYWMLGDYQMAKHFIDETFKMSYSLKAEWYELGSTIYNKLGDAQTAYSCINRAIVCNPFYAVLYYKRARILFSMNKIQVALLDLNKAISFEPKYVNALKLRAEIKTILGDKDGARKDLSIAKLLHKA